MDLKQLRQEGSPEIPQIFHDLFQVSFAKEPAPKPPANIPPLFPHSHEQPVLRGQLSKNARASKPLRVGVVFSGGQAAGGHNVVIGLHNALKKLHQDSRLFGFLDGPEGIIAGKNIELTSEKIAPYRNQGGFDMLGSGRTKIETDEQLASALRTMQNLKLDGLVVIGGDDSNTNAAILTEYFLKNSCPVKVIGVPKTIDGDLKNPFVGISFGFDTACRTYSEIIGNISRDALSAKKYYHFIKLMGRSASHIALECALQTRPNLTLIGEEVAEKKMTLSQIAKEIASLISERAAAGKNYGVILIPEGLIEFFPEIGILIKEINKILSLSSGADIASQLTPASQACFYALPEKIRDQLLHTRDPHGNVQVSLIETEHLIIEIVLRELKDRKKFSPIAHFLGYEGRSAFPTHFDSNYCYALGCASALLIDEGASGYMAYISNLSKPISEWGFGGVPLVSLLHLESRNGKEKPVIQKALVDLKAGPFAQFARERNEMRMKDDYRNPGPIQFFGNSELTHAVPITLQLQS